MLPFVYFIACCIYYMFEIYSLVWGIAPHSEHESRMLWAGALDIVYVIILVVYAKNYFEDGNFFIEFFWIAVAIGYVGRLIRSFRTQFKG